MSTKGDSKLFYEALGVSRLATNDEIKRAYRKLAMQWHPDKNIDKKEEATEKFKIINEAYEILGDPDKRRDYDGNGTEENRGGYYRSTMPQDDLQSQHREHFRPSFTDARAHEIFNNFFANFASAFDDDFFLDDWTPFPQFDRSHKKRGKDPQSRKIDEMSGFDFGFGAMDSEMDRLMNMNAMKNDSDFAMFGWDPFFAGGREHANGRNRENLGRPAQGSTSRSVSTTTTIDACGRKTVRTEIITRSADGSVQRSVTSDGPPELASQRSSNIAISRNSPHSKRKSLY